MGSGQLIATLMRHYLVDEFMLTIHPIVLGSGRRLFPDNGTTATLELVDTTPTSNGVVMVTYRSTGGPS